MANRLRIAHDSYVNHALLSCCYDESTLDSIHQFGRFLFMVTLDSIHDSTRDLTLESSRSKKHQNNDSTLESSRHKLLIVLSESSMTL